MANYDRLNKDGLLYYTQQIKTKIEDHVPADMTGATATTAGAHGLVPAPAAGDEGKFLTGAGTWVEETTYGEATTTTAGLMSAADKGKVDGIEAGAEVNEIESISFNGTTITPDADRNAEITINNASESADGLMSATDKTKLNGIEAGGQVNVIETVKVNGTALVPDQNKAVDVTVPTAVSDLTNDANYQNAQQVEAAILVKGVQVNGSDLTPDISKKVNVVVPTKTSDITNDSDFQTGDEVDAAIAAALITTLKPGGTKTFATLPILAASVLGYVYNVSDAFTVDNRFVEYDPQASVQKSYPAGSNVYVVDDGTAGSAVYKFDVLPGFVDLSGYVQHSEMSAITNAEIDTIIATAFGA